jgi:hypothetical protein
VEFSGSPRHGPDRKQTVTKIGLARHQASSNPRIVEGVIRNGCQEEGCEEEGHEEEGCEEEEVVPIKLDLARPGDWLAKCRPIPDF